MTTAPIEAFTFSREPKQGSLVIELPAVVNRTGKKSLPLSTEGLAGARFSRSGDKLSLVLDADKKEFPQFRVEKTDKGIKVTLQKEEVSGQPVEKPAGKAKETGVGYFYRYVIHFDTGQTVISPRYFPMLKKAATVLKKNPDAVAELKGHSDSVGKAEYNLLLSKRRAGSVRNYLVKDQGISPSRIVVNGYGSYRPIADNRSAEGRRKNRRTNMTIVIRKNGKASMDSVGGAASAPAADTQGQPIGKP